MHNHCNPAKWSCIYCNRSQFACNDGQQFLKYLASKKIKMEKLCYWKELSKSSVFLLPLLSPEMSMNQNFWNLLRRIITKNLCWNKTHGRKHSSLKGSIGLKVCDPIINPSQNTCLKYRDSTCIGGSRGGVRDARPSLGVQILSISCSFQENLACSRPPWRVHAPPSGKSWIRHWHGRVKLVCDVAIIDILILLKFTYFACLPFPLLRLI